MYICVCRITNFLVYILSRIKQCFHLWIPNQKLLPLTGGFWVVPHLGLSLSCSGWGDQLFCKEAVCWLQLCREPDVAGCIPRSQLCLLLETPEHGQIRGIFHNCLFGKHPAKDGNFGRVGRSWVGAEWLLEQFFLVCQGLGLQPELFTGSISISIFRGDELMGQEMVSLL